MDYTFRTRHWNDLALKGAFEDVPVALINHEGRKRICTGESIGFCHHPGWRIRDTLHKRNTNVRFELR
jgi:hypothetical protein